MTIKSDPSCEWCKNENQTSIHLFLECPQIQPIWDQVSDWLREKLNCLLIIKMELIFLHHIEAGNFTIMINLIILVVTRYIYVCHCIDKHPSFTMAHRQIVDLEPIERCIAKKNDTLFKHNKKWRLSLE